MSCNVYDIAVKTIDARNSQLLEKTEIFLEGYEERSKSEVVYSTLDFLEANVVEHFKEEEALQVSSNYPKYHEHKMMHDSFIEDVILLKKRLNENGESAENMVYLTEILLRWVINHIDSTDIHFSTYYRSIPHE